MHPGSLLKGRQQGSAYLWLLLVLFLMAIGLGRALDIYHVTIQRYKEAELLYAGTKYRDAIASYYMGSPGGSHQYPATLQDLLVDTRYFTLRRHLRRQYVDPFAPDQSWGLIRNQEGQITGVFSRTSGDPFKQDNFPSGLESFRGAKAHSEWRFVYTPAPSNLESQR